MDEPANAKVAYDFGPQQTYAKVRGHTFIPGNIGKAMRSTGSGIAKTRNTHIDLTEDFTVCFWLRNRVELGYVTPLGTKASVRDQKIVCIRVFSQYAGY